MSFLFREIDRSIPFVDTYHHITEPSKHHYEWLTDDALKRNVAALGDYRIATCDWPMTRLLREFYGSNVVKSVHVEAHWSGDPVDETTYLAMISKEFGMPNAFVVMCDMESGDVRAQLQRHLDASSLVRGVRIDEHPKNPLDSVFLENLKALAERGLHFETRAWPGALTRVFDSAVAVPQCRFVIGAGGMPRSESQEHFQLWKSEMAKLATLPNVHCKIGGLGMFIHDWSVDRLRPWVLAMIELFTPKRVMFGTNWPLDATYASYLMTVDAYRIILADAKFSHEDQTLMLCKNAEAFYGI